MTQLSSLFLARLFMLRPMIFLTVNAAISNKLTSGAQLQFNAIDCCFTTRSATRCRVGFFFIGSAHIITYNER
jgi:hypothetical protein